LVCVDQTREQDELRVRSRPEFEVGPAALTVVDLFAGCGGLTLGTAQAAHAFDLALDVRLALDLEEAATEVYEENFKKARVETASVDDYFDGALGAEPTDLEAETREAVGELSLLVGGPPCQGHSNLNNHTRRDDPKNALYARMARAAEVLEPTFVMVENVPSVRHDISDVVGTARAHLVSAGYVVAETTLPLHPLGVAQRRKRHVLLASRTEGVDPAAILGELAQRKPDSAHSLRWAIEDLKSVAPVGYDSPPRASAENQRRMQYLLATGEHDLPNSERPKCHQGEHSYKSMYGRLSWDLPAQTITSGFGSIGQGRYMHPDLARALTPHEAARIQGFPDYFSFETVRRRADLATMIGNAVPPVLAREVVLGLLRSLSTSEPDGE
jgi:DNA (cytosine-5)-methyltransferase 1